MRQLTDRDVEQWAASKKRASLSTIHDVDAERTSEEPSISILGRERVNRAGRCAAVLAVVGLNGAVRWRRCKLSIHEAPFCLQHAKQAYRLECEAAFEAEAVKQAGRRS